LHQENGYLSCHICRYRRIALNQPADWPCGEAVLEPGTGRIAASPAAN
jgi:hypothetical protein